MKKTLLERLFAIWAKGSEPEPDEVGQNGSVSETGLSGLKEGIQALIDQLDKQASGERESTEIDTKTIRVQVVMAETGRTSVETNLDIPKDYTDEQIKGHIIEWFFRRHRISWYEKQVKGVGHG